MFFEITVTRIFKKFVVDKFDKKLFKAVCFFI